MLSAAHRADAQRASMPPPNRSEASLSSILPADTITLNTNAAAPIHAASMWPSTKTGAQPPPPLFSPASGGKSLLAKAKNRSAESLSKSPVDPIMTLPEVTSPQHPLSNGTQKSDLSPIGTLQQNNLKAGNGQITGTSAFYGRSGSDAIGGIGGGSSAGSAYGGGGGSLICRSQRGMGTEPSDVATPLSEVFDQCGGGTGATHDLDVRWPNASGGTPCSSYFNAFVPIDISRVRIADDEQVLAGLQNQLGQGPTTTASHRGESATFSRVTSHHSLMPFDYDYYDRDEVEADGVGRGLGNAAVFHQRAYSIASTVGGSENSELLSTTDGSAEDLTAKVAASAEDAKMNEPRQKRKSSRSRSKGKTTHLGSADTVAAVESPEIKAQTEPAPPTLVTKKQLPNSSSGTSLTSTRHKASETDREALLINNSSPHLLVLPSRAPDYQLMRTFARSYFPPTFFTTGVGGHNHPVFAGLQVASIFAAAIQKRFPNGIPMSYHPHLTQLATAPLFGFNFNSNPKAGKNTTITPIKGSSKARSATSPSSVMTQQRISPLAHNSLSTTPTPKSASSPSTQPDQNNGAFGASGTFTPFSVSVSPQAIRNGRIGTTTTTPSAKGKLGISKSASSIGGDFDIVSVPSPSGSFSVIKKWRGPNGTATTSGILMHTVASIRELPSGTNRDREGAVSDTTSFDIVSVGTSVRGPTQRQVAVSAAALNRQQQHQLNATTSTLNNSSTPTPSPNDRRQPLPKVRSTDSWATMSSVRQSPMHSKPMDTNANANAAVEEESEGEDSNAPEAKTLLPAIVECRPQPLTRKGGPKARQAEKGVTSSSMSTTKPTSANPYKNQNRAAPTSTSHLSRSSKSLSTPLPSTDSIVTVTETIRPNATRTSQATANSSTLRRSRQSSEQKDRWNGGNGPTLSALVELSIGKAAKYLSVKDYEELTDSDEEDDESSYGGQ